MNNFNDSSVTSSLNFWTLSQNLAAVLATFKDHIVNLLFLLSTSEKLCVDDSNIEPQRRRRGD
jgi:hypothetical protein